MFIKFTQIIYASEVAISSYQQKIWERAENIKAFSELEDGTLQITLDNDCTFLTQSYTGDELEKKIVAIEKLNM